MDKFWMCFIEGASSPQHVYASKEAAKQAAAAHANGYKEPAKKEMK